MGKNTSQTTTTHNGVPARAVDGNTSGIWGQRSITHTASGVGQWWQVDLGNIHRIVDMTIFNRTNCCTHRLGNFTVSISNSSGGNPIWSQTITTEPSPSVMLNIPAGLSGGM